MDEHYARTVRLLLTAAPAVFDNAIFAMKGGTAINLFIQDMPRLSVDIDVVYIPWQPNREEALHDIAAELERIRARLAPLGLIVRTLPSRDQSETKLFIENEISQVKVEVNFVFRGTVLSVLRQPLSRKTAELFSVELAAPLLAPDELYGSKLVAAMDRQHPRDLFDVWRLFETGGLSDATIECFVTYLAGHNRPFHEVLFGTDKAIEREYQDHFVGMTAEAVPLETLLAARTRLREELSRRLTSAQRRFLISLSQAQPEWNLLHCPYASELPALRWKLANLETFKKRRPDDFREQALLLEQKLTKHHT
jgi:hypothetical protein